MEVTKLIETLETYEDVQPTARQKAIAEKIKERFEKVIADLGTNNLISIDERTCLAGDLGEDYPEVRIIVQTEDLEDFFFASYVFPVGEEEDIKNNLDSCPLSVSLYSDVFGLDEIYAIDDVGTTEEEQLDKLENRIRAELNIGK